MNGASLEPTINSEPLTGTEWAHQEHLTMLRLGAGHIPPTDEHNPGEPL